MINFLKKLLLCLVLIGAFSPATAQETLPPYHWANEYIEYLKVRGMLPKLSVVQRPYQRQQVAKYLLQADWANLNQDSRTYGMIRTLFQEFSPEIQRLGNLKENNWGDLIQRGLELLQLELLPETVNPVLKVGGFGEGLFISRNTDIDALNSSDPELDLHGQAALFWQDYLTVYNNTRLFTNPDPSYRGKEFSGLYAYTEQGYVAIDNGWLQAKFGRDFMQLGPGRSGQLLISDNSRPYDQYHVQLGKSFLQFSFWGFDLNERLISDTALVRFDRDATRRLNGHRISLNFENKFHLGFSEVVLYGGPNGSWEFKYMNPVGLYYAHAVNRFSKFESANVLYSIDWDWYLNNSIELYGEFLLDDLQLESEESSDLEPNEFGFLLGTNVADLGVPGTLLNLEYVQVRNRTYNVRFNDWEKYLHRGEEIGYHLGNNFYRLGGSLSYWASPTLQFKFFADLIRQGEGTVGGEFNTDYLAFSVDEGYEEDFPFGVVEKRFDWGLTGFYRPHPRANIRADLRLASFDNFEHLEGASFSDVTVNIGLWLQWSKLWTY